jgi:hypothetical protein
MDSSLYLLPITISANPPLIGLISLDISFGSCCPSVSNVTMLSGLYLRYSLNPFLNAAPFPLFSLFLNTITSSDCDWQKVSSFEPSSITIIVFTYLRVVSKFFIPFDSLYVGRIAIMFQFVIFCRSLSLLLGGNSNIQY